MANTKQKRSVSRIGAVEELIGCSLTEVEKEYLPHNPLFDTSEVISRLRELNFSERRLLIIYSECKTLAKVAKVYNCDRRTILKRINGIRAKFKNIKKYD